MTDKLKETELRTRAYEIWEAEGRPDGRAEEHWEQAREELEAAKPKDKAKAQTKTKPAKKTVAAKTKKSPKSKTSKEDTR